MKEKKEPKQSKSGGYPANARVDVDYTQDKPKIKFSFPKNGKTPEQQAKSQHMSNPISLILLAIILYGTTIFVYLPLFDFGIDYPDNCEISWNQINTSMYFQGLGIVNGEVVSNISTNTSTSKIYGANITCGEEITYLYFDKGKKSLAEYGEKNLKIDYFKGKSNGEVWSEALFELACLWIGFVIWLVINKFIILKYLLNAKWYQKWFPKSQAKGGTKYYKRFYPKDLENNLAIIPRFKNVVLEYKAHGDFSKQLERVKIREDQYNKMKKGKPEKKKTVELFKWSAIFSFKNKPKNGYLEVVYK